VAPYITPEWGDIPARRSRIHPSRQKPGWRSAAGVKVATVQPVSHQYTFFLYEAVYRL